MAGWPPKKNAAFTWYFTLRDADGDLVAGAAGLDAEVSIDGGAFADITAVEVDEGQGFYSVALTAAEMNGDVICLICKTTTTGAKSAAQVIYTSTNQIDDSALASVCTEARLSELDAANMPADLDAVKADTDSLDTTKITTARANNLDQITSARLAELDAANIPSDVDNIKEASFIRRNTAQAGAANTITLDAGASATNDFYNELWIVLIGGTGVGQARVISDYVGSTKVATITPNWVTNPDATSVFMIIPAARNDTITAGTADWTAAEKENIRYRLGVDGTQTAPTNTPTLPVRLDTQGKSDVNAEVVDALNVDNYAEPGQLAPPSTTTLANKLSYLYKFLRNKKTNDGSTIKIYDDAGTTVDQKAAVSETSGVVTIDEFAIGP